MSGTVVPTPNTQISFAALTKSLATQSVEVYTAYQSGNFPLKYAERAIALDFFVRSVFKELARLNISEHAEALCNLNKAQETLLNFFPFSDSYNVPIAKCLHKFAEQILAKKKPRAELLVDLQQAVPAVIHFLDAIYQEVAKLVNTSQGEKSAAEHGKTLFEDPAQDSETIAQAVFNVAVQENVITPFEFENHKKFYVSTMKTDRVYEKATKNFPEPLDASQYLIGFLASAMQSGSTQTAQEQDSADLSAIGKNMKERVNQLQSSEDITIPEKTAISPTTTSEVTTTVNTPDTQQGTTIVSTLVPPTTTSEVTTTINTPDTQQGTPTVSTLAPPTTTSEVTTTVSTPVHASTTLEVTVPEQPASHTEGDPEELQAALSALQEARKTHSNLVFNTHATTFRVNMNKIREQADKELRNDVPREEQTQNAAVTEREIRELEAVLANIRGQIHANNARLEEEQLKHDELTKNYQSAQQNVAKLTEQEKNAKEGLKLQQDEITKWQLAFEKATENVKAANEHIAELNRRAQELETQLTTNDTTQIRKDIKDVALAIQQANTDRLKLNNSCDEVMASLRLVQEALLPVEKHAKEASEAVLGAEDEMLRYPMQIDDVKQRIATIEKENAGLTQKAAVEEAAFNKAKEQHAESNQRLVPSGAGKEEELTPEKRKAKVNEIYFYLLRPSTWTNVDLSGTVMRLLTDLPEDLQEMIKEHVFTQSQDKEKTKDDAWFKGHIADGQHLHLLYVALEDTMNKIAPQHDVTK